MNKKQKGFTLIELMIVVAIIGILAAIAIPKFADMLEKSREGATKGNYTAIRSAVNMYYGDLQGQYPTNLADTHPTWSVGGPNDYNFVGKYVDKIPPVKATGKNAVNLGLPGPGKVASTADQVLHSTWVFANTTGVGWRFDSIEGRLWVNSTMVDMLGKPYTVYGYE